MKTLSANLPLAALTALAALLIAMSAPALARSSDRNEPMIIDAGRSEYVMSDGEPTVLSEGVRITQGTLDIHSSRAEISQRDGEPVLVVLTGSPVTLKQKLDDGTPMNATAARIDYDLLTEVLVLTGDVHIKQPDNSLTSDRVVYNLRTGRVTSGGQGAGRVQMRIMPEDNGGDGGDDGGEDRGEDGGENQGARDQDAAGDDDAAGDKPPAATDQPRDDSAADTGDAG